MKIWTVAMSAAITAFTNPANAESVLTDFTADSPDLGWFVVNDNVMGGRSEGDFQTVEGELRFTGHTNTNGGGFSSIRTEIMQLDLSSHDGIQLRLKGDGRRYTWRLTTTARWRGRPVSYWADFEAPVGTWSTVNIPFSSFIPQYRGNQLDGPALDPAQIQGMGLMIYDKQDGPFEMCLAQLRAYSGEPTIALPEHR
jgi:monofunctional biosynthetic peptidoglycan transglycosylase